MNSELSGKFRLRAACHTRENDTVIEIRDGDNRLCGTLWPTPEGIRLQGSGFTLQLQAPDGTEGPAIRLANDNGTEVL